jgi:hypothetical protein
MDQKQASDPTLTTNPAKLVGQLAAAVILADGVWGLLSSLTSNLLVPLLARVMNGDPGSPTYLGKGEVNVPALFNSFLALCLAGIVFLLLYGWSQRKPAPARAKMMRVPKEDSQPAPGPLSIIAPPNAVVVPAQVAVNPPPTLQISQAPVIPPVPTPQQLKPTPAPVAGPAKPVKPQHPKEVYYNLVGEPINPTEDK